MTSVYQDQVASEDRRDESVEQVQIEVSEEVITQEVVGDEVEDLSARSSVEVSRSEVYNEIYSNSGSAEDKDKKFSIAKFLGRLSVNLILPFINGLMLGFGEIIAHEIGFKYNWTGARVYPQRRMIDKNTKLL